VSRSVLFFAGLVASFALAVPVFAQTQTVPSQSTPTQAAMKTLRFDDAVHQAIDRNPTVAQAAANVTRAEALLQQARSATLPVVGASVINTTLDSARGFSGGVTQPQDQVTFGADVSVPVLAATRWAAVTQSRDQIEVAQLSLAQVRQQIGVAAAEAYLAVIASRRLVEVDERALESARAHLDYAQKRLDAGGGTRLDQVRAAQIAAGDESRLEITRLALRRAQEALGVLVVEPGPVDAAEDPVLDVPGGLDESQWMAARPDVTFQQSVIRAAERVVRDSWKDWVPTGTADFVPQVVGPSGLFQPAKTWRLTLLFTQPVYDAGQRRSLRALRDVTLDQSKIELTDIQIRARSEVRLAQEVVAGSDRALTASRRSADTANEALRITTSAFQVGATTNIEVIDAQRSARDAETGAVISEDLLRRAKLDLLVAIGRFPR